MAELQVKSDAGLFPTVIGFCCTYCAYTAADLAGSMRLSYSPCVRIVKLTCTGKIDSILLLKAFASGVDAVYVAGCARGDCHFLKGNLRAIEVVAYTRKLLAEIGLEPERLEFFHIPASAGPLFAQRARELGPSPLRMGSQAARGTAWPRSPDAHPPLPPATHGRLIRHGERRLEAETAREEPRS